MRHLRMILKIAAILVLGNTLFGCNDNTAAKELLISKEQFGDKWPFTVASGTLRCNSLGQVTLKTSEGVFGINGSAKDGKNFDGDAVRKKIGSGDLTVMADVSPIIFLAKDTICKNKG